MNNRTARHAAMVAAFWGKQLSQKEWYSVKQADDNGQAEIRIYDVIGWPFVEADAFASDLNNIDAKEIKVRINSPGGDVFDGTAIQNMLENHPAKITTSIEGLAASMASIIALAGDDIEIAKNAYFMMHNPWSFSYGEAKDFEKEAGLLNRIGSTLNMSYADKSGKSSDEIKTLMDETTWLIGQEAVDAGFADRITSKNSATAKFDLSIYGDAPKGSMPTSRDLERVLTQDAGLTRNQARKLLQGGLDNVVMQDADNKTLEALDKLHKRI